MNKLVILIIGILVIAIIISLLVLNFFGRKPVQPTPTLSPSPPTATPIQTSIPIQPLTINSSYPANNTQDFPPNATLSFTFNRNIDTDVMSVTFNPAVQFNQTIASDLLLIKPKTELKPSTIYSVVVLGKDMAVSYTIQFQTAAQNPKDTSPTAEGIKQIEDTLRKAQPPNAYLANKLPYSTSDFSATSANRPTTNNLYFIVVLQGTDKVSAKNAFLDWLRSLQLTDTQIQGLDIEYQ